MEELLAKSQVRQQRVATPETVVPGVSAYVVQGGIEDWLEGGFGTVTRVKRISDGKTLVAKFIHLRTLNEEYQRRVIREIDNMERVKHVCGCVALEEHFFQDDFVEVLHEEFYYHAAPQGPCGLAMVLILEHMTEDISRMIQSGELADVEFACPMFLQVIVALHQIHCLNMIHRDIGAGNILVDRLLVKIADFGFSNSYEGETLRQDAVQTQLGTISYRPPEVWKKERYGAAADIFALGVLMYEAIAREWAFGQFDCANVREMVVDKRARPLDCGDKRVTALVADMLQQDPAQRPTTWEILGSAVMQEAFATLMRSFDHQIGQSDGAPADGDALLRVVACRQAIDAVMRSIPPCPRYQ